MTNDILDFVSFTLVVQQIRQIAQILQHLFIEFDMAFVVNNVFTLINQETTLVDSSVIFISKLTIFILQKDGFARLVIIVKVAHNLMWIEIPFLKSVRHRQITEILTSLLYGHKKIFISESTPDSSRLLVNQIPFLIHQLTIKIPKFILFNDSFPVYDPAFGIEREISQHFMHVERSLVDCHLFSEESVEVFSAVLADGRF